MSEYKKLYEIEDFRNKKVQAKDFCFEDWQYLVLTEDGWFDEEDSDYSYYISLNFFKPIWREYKPKAKLRAVKERFFVSKDEKIILDKEFDTYQEAQKYIYSQCTDGIYQILKRFIVRSGE